MARKLIVEAIGTFFFVLVIGMSVIVAAGAGWAPIPIGSSLMVMVYAGGHISGGHYNPAVSLAAMLRGKLGRGELLPYWGAQVGGALLAALTVRYLTGGISVSAFEPAVAPAFLAEFLFTFALAYMVLNVATSKATAGNSFYGLAIGFTVLIGAFSVGSVSGGAFNPAVAVGITAIGLSAASSLWVLLLADLLGGAAAAWIYNTLDLGDERGGKS